MEEAFLTMAQELIRIRYMSGLNLNLKRIEKTRETGLFVRDEAFLTMAQELIRMRFMDEIVS
jgi:hypothetical protein